MGTRLRFGRLVLVSAVERHGPGAASPGAAAATASSGVALEWKSVLTTTSVEPDSLKRLSSSAKEYWTQFTKKLKRMESEP